MDDDMNAGPKDEYLHNYIASKVEARKIMNSPQFEDMVSKFWHLLRKDEGLVDLSSVTITKQQYTFVSLLSFSKAARDDARRDGSLV